MAKTKIEWTEKTINPTMGCSITSPGCEHCYAMRQAYRLETMGVKGYEGTTKKLASGKIVWTGKINFDISKLQKAVNTRIPTTFFVDSMSDLFHTGVPFSFIDSVYEIMGYHTEHIFQILTKRPERALEYYKWTNIFNAWGEWNHIWLGTSVENQAEADKRIPYLLKIPTKVRWISVEPLLGEINLKNIPIKNDLFYDSLNGDIWQYQKSAIFGFNREDLIEAKRNKLGWVIVGGESGPKARPMNPNWVRSLRDQCISANVPFFFKQWGGVNKKEAGRLLDGREWNEYPA